MKLSATVSTLIVDDEQLARDELSFLLKEFPDIEVVGAASNGFEALKLIEELEPDLVFLDVQMPGLDGLGVMNRVREKSGHIPHFVLTTAFDSYAVEAFRFEAFDYLVKPIERERLAESILRIRKALEEKTGERIPASVPYPPAPSHSKLLVRTNNRNLIVDPQEVVYATIEDGLITVVTSQFEGQSNYRTIEELQSNLDPNQFWRVHRSFLVNIDKIREVIPWFKSSFQLKMDDKKQTEIPVSRIQTKRLRSLLKI